ncbi:hypothetical protein HOY80DRAFT_1059170 [Tuber brumale]|nr:hypothetical protein HOY80DRAFT_1059170 [Tuber brumale]
MSVKLGRHFNIYIPCLHVRGLLLTTMPPKYHSGFDTQTVRNTGTEVLKFKVFRGTEFKYRFSCNEARWKRLREMKVTIVWSRMIAWFKEEKIVVVFVNYRRKHEELLFHEETRSSLTTSD